MGGSAQQDQEWNIQKNYKAWDPSALQGKGGLAEGPMSEPVRGIGNCLG